MRFDILKTNVDLKARNHRVYPENMSIGGFTIYLDGIEIIYDHSESSGNLVYDYDENGKDIPLIEWSSSGDSEIYIEDRKEIENPENYTLTCLKGIPEISRIEEISYEAFTNIPEGVEYEFYPISFEIELYDKELKKSYIIGASQEVLDDYIKRNYKD